MNWTRPRTVLRVTLDQIAGLAAHGIDVRPNAHHWVNDESIQQHLDAGYLEDTRIPHHAGTNRAGRVCCYVRNFRAGTVPRKAFATLYTRRDRLKLKLVDGNTRMRAVQFMRDAKPIELHVFGPHQDRLRSVLPPSCFVRTEG